MSYLVFARKYRPQTFEDIVAQEHVTRTLQNSIKNDRTGSGYLFCGPRGTGKTTTARILAKAVNCINGPTPVPCGECSACIEITKGSSLDVLEIDAASNTGVDDIRTLRENVRYLPTNGKKRIYIIDEVHRLSGPAFDALLKTLEEPPPHVMFIFATTEPTKVPETILSRTQRFDFKRVSVADLAKHLGSIASKEKLHISESALRMISRKADGSVRDSLSLMDQIAAYATGEITEKEVIEALGLVDQKFLFDFTTAIAGKQSRTALELMKQIFDGGIDPKDFVAELLEHLRVLLVLATDKSAGELLELGEDEMKEYVAQVDYFSIGDIIRLMKMAGELNRDLKDSGLDERLLLEMTAVKMAEMEATIKFEEILSIMKQNPGSISAGDLFGSPEKKKSDGPGDRITFVRRQSESHSTDTAPPVFARAVNLPIIKSGWHDFLNVLRPKRPMLASQLGMVEVREMKDNLLVLVFPASGENSKLIVEKADNFALIVSAVREYFKANVGVRFEIDRDKALPDTLAEQNGSTGVDIVKLVENSPRIKKLLEKVDGQIIGVRKVK